MDKANSTDKLSVEHEAYLRRWGLNAAYFERQGCYGWMAGKATLGAPARLLDVGCGDGTHRHLYHPITTTTDSQVTLFQSDVLSDPYLMPYIQSTEGIDVITVWLIGSHLERSNCSNIRHLLINSSGEYRLRVQNKAYKLADALLRPEGILHIVDRGEVPSSDVLKGDFFNAHRHQASVTSMEVFELDYMLYEEPHSPDGMVMQVTPGMSGRAPNMERTAMISVRSRKPGLAKDQGKA